MNKFVGMLAGVALAGTSLLAQQQPKLKSKAEQEAVMAIFNAQGPDAQIAAVDGLLSKFADTEFKAIALQIATDAARQKGDYEKLIIYGERTLQADPKNFAAMLIMSQSIAQRTREHDLDKEEKLKQAEKYANDAIELVKTAVKPRPDLDDAQWEMAKKDFTAQGQEALGLAAMVRKKYPEAAGFFKAALDAQPQQDPATKIRLASAYNFVGNYDGALALIDALLADPQLHPTIRQVAGQEKLKAAQGKAAKK